MSQWGERVRNSPVWGQLEALGPAIDDALVKADLDAISIESLERLRAVLAFVGKRLAGLDPSLVLQAPLDGVGANMQNAVAELRAFVADANAGHLVNANASADAALSNLAGLPGIEHPSELTTLSQAAVTYRNTLVNIMSRVQKAAAQANGDLEGVRSRASELAAEIAAERQRLSQVVSDFQAQFSGAQEARSAEYSKAQADRAAEIAAERQRLSQVVSEFQAQFSGAQEARGAEYSKAQADRQERFGALVAEYTSRLTLQDAESAKVREAALSDLHADLEAFSKDYRSQAATILADVDKHRRDVEKLVGVIGNLGVTSGYLRTANQARLAGWIWQGITVGALSLLIFVAYKIFLPVVAGGFTWPGLVSRIFLSLTVGVLAAYAGSQADKYVKSEARNRRLALELEALGPFLAPVSDEKKEAFRLAIGEKSFGREAGEAGDEHSPATVVDVLSKSKEFQEIIAQAVRSGMPR